MDSKNLSIEQLRDVYIDLNRTLGYTASEVTFTVDPGKVHDVSSLKRKFMDIVKRRLLACHGIKGFIVTREDHDNSGFPHAHGIVWFDYNQNNAPTLCCGNPRVEVRRKLRWVGDLDDKPVKYQDFSPLGRGAVYKLRKELYKDGKGREWCDHLEYICKDQKISWSTKNIVWVEKRD